MARLKVITPTTNISSGSIGTNFIKDDAVTLAKLNTTGASNGQVLAYNSTSGAVEWASNAVYTDANAVDAWEAAAGITSTSTNKILSFNKSVTRGVEGYTYWDSDEFWIGDAQGIVIEDNKIAPWGNNNPPLILGGANTGTGGISIDSSVEFVQTTHANAATTFNQPVEFNNPIQVDSTSVFNNTVEFNNPIQVDGTSVFNAAVDFNQAMQVDNNLTVTGTTLFDTTSPVKIECATAGLTNPVLHLEVEESNWSKAQLLLEDSNDDVVAIVGRRDDTLKNYQLNYTLDPNNTKARTNVGGAGTTYPGDYFMAFEKDWYDLDEIKMVQKVFGAHNGFEIRAYDDSNGSTFNPNDATNGSRHYKAKPIRLMGSEVELYASTSGATEATVKVLEVEETRVTINTLTRLHNAGSDPSNPLEGDVYYNTGTDRVKLYTGAGWKTLSVD